MSFHAPSAGQPRPTQHALSRSSALFGNSIRGGRRFKQAFEVLAEAGDVAVADAGDGEPFQDGAQLLELSGRSGGVSGRMAGGESFQQGAEFGESAQFSGGHGINMQNRASGYATEVKGVSISLQDLKTQSRARLIIQTARAYAKSSISSRMQFPM
jgi:hypothetical protein